MDTKDIEYVKYWAGEGEVRLSPESTIELCTHTLELKHRVTICEECSVLDNYNKALARVEKLEEVLERPSSWAEAYPISMFPEPDLRRASRVLVLHGMTLDSISASNMRHVLNRMKDIIKQALKGSWGE